MNGGINKKPDPLFSISTLTFNDLFTPPPQVETGLSDQLGWNVGHLSPDVGYQLLDGLGFGIEDS